MQVPKVEVSASPRAEEAFAKALKREMAQSYRDFFKGCQDFDPSKVGDEEAFRGFLSLCWQRDPK